MHSAINGTWPFLFGKFERKCSAQGESVAVLGSSIRSAAHLVKVRRTWELSSIFFLRFIYDVIWEDDFVSSSIGRYL